jgi:hypothetical protein
MLEQSALIWGLLTVRTVALILFAEEIMSQLSLSLTVYVGVQS